MAVIYMPLDGELVSAEWHTLLEDLRETGLRFRVNEGHRTMQRQAYFYALYKSGKGNLAARPSPTAPHIRTGRYDHAIDFDNAAGVIAAAGNRYVTISLPVRGESWHGEANAEELLAYHHAHRWPPATLRPGSARPRGDVIRLERLLRKAGALPSSHRARGSYSLSVRVAVKAWQRKNGLKGDAIVGPGTWKTLARYR